MEGHEDNLVETIDHLISMRSKNYECVGPLDMLNLSMLNTDSLSMET